jgi:broad specificity phosphatase PhoE
LPGFRLSALGEQMAQEAAKALAGRDVTLVVSSPLERARQTAEPVAAQFGLPVEIDERLIESENFFEGKRVGVGDGALRDPRNWHLLRNPFRPSWGEPYLDVAARMRAALLEARRRAEGHEAVCVSHQLPIWVLRRHLEGRRLWHDPRRRECALASVTSVHFRGESVVDITYTSPAAHLIVGSAKTAKGA